MLCLRKLVGTATLIVSSLCYAETCHYTIADKDTVALRDAVTKAASSGSAQTICLAGTYYDLSGGYILINKGTITIRKKDSVSSKPVLDGLNKNKLFYLNGNSSVRPTLTLENVELTHGYSSSYGGALYSYYGTLALKSSILSYNTSVSDGGALLSSLSSITITNSTLMYNKSSYRGGAIKLSNSNLDLRNSTLHDNSAIEGGAMDVFQDADSVTSYLKVQYSTFINNTASTLGDIFTIENRSWHYSITFKGSIFDSSASALSDCSGYYPDSQGYNLGTDYSCNLVQGTDAIYEEGIDGLTLDTKYAWYYKPNKESPAFNAIPEDSCTEINSSTTAISKDQLNTVRAQETGCEIGSYEVVGMTMSSPSVSEGSSYSRIVEVQVTLEDPAARTLYVSYSGNNGTAYSGSDYMVAGSVTFYTGDTARTLSGVSIYGNTAKESPKSEYFYVNLNEGCAGCSTTVTIKDDD